MTRRLAILNAFALFAFVAPSSAASLSSGTAVLTVDDGAITIQKAGKRVIQLDAISFNYEHALEWQIQDADAAHIVLVGTFPAAADFYRRPEDTRARTVELHITKEPSGFRLFAKPEWGRQVTLEFEHLGDHFFGLSEPLQPDNRLSPDLTGTSIVVDVASEGESLHENYASVYSAFYMSSFGYGAFYDTFARGRYELGINGKNRIHHDTGTLDWRLFFGDDGREIQRAYFSLIGQPKPVPAWGLGPVGWRDQNQGADEILADVEHMSKLHIPWTAWFVDRPYSDGTHGWSDLNFSEAFAQPEQWIAKLRDRYGLEFMTWTTTAFFGNTRFPKHLAGKFTYLDLSHPETVRQLQNELTRKQHAVGVKGHKVDRGDEGFPQYEDWYDTTVPIAERRNKYAYLMAKVHDEALRASWGDDQITFVRTAIHRAQPYVSAIWGGDPRATWDGLKSNFANAARTSFIGFPVWGTDVGGYQGEGHIPQDLYIRWLQAGSMAGLFEIKLDGAGGEGRDRMPWRYDEAFQRIFRAICEERMRLIPYFYSLSHTSGRTGTLMQPLAYRHLGDPKTYDRWDEFYVGDALLVAPVFGPESSRDVYLPFGEWRDFDDPAIAFKGGRVITVEAPLAKLPRFVKENSVYVTGNLYRGNDRLWDTSERVLTVHAYPGRRDSASAFTYVDMLDSNAQKRIELQRRGNEVYLKSPALPQTTVLEVLVDKEPKSVQLNGQAAEAQYDDRARLVSVRAKKDTPIDLRISL